MDQLATEGTARRMVDKTNAQAKDAVADTLSRFSAWRGDLTKFRVSSTRATASERRKMLERCAEIEDELLVARTDLIIGLAGAPQKVTGHSRVVDVERALDGVDAQIRSVRQELGA